MSDENQKTYDIIVVGAGPAGMSAATAAAEVGASVLLLDEQPSPGGQIYRGILSAPEARAKILGSSYTEGLAITKAFSQSSVTYQPLATVWQFDESGSLIYSVEGEVTQAKGSHILLATGALERPVPIPGWTLPGVMTAGAAQILLKSSGVVPDNAVLAGSGPLLYLLATQLIRAGSPPKALVETQTFKDALAAMRFFPLRFSAWKMLAKGFLMMREIKKAGIPRYKAAKGFRAEGSKQVEALSFDHKEERLRLECETLLLHQGVVPNTQITRSLRVQHRWNKRQACFHPFTNGVGLTTNSNYSIIGDGRAIAGAQVAVLEGRSAGSFVAASLGFNVDPADVFKQQKIIKKERAVRSFLDRLYQPPKEILTPANGATVCRCEEVTAGKIREYATIGCLGPNQTKAFGRSGMGPCQGRYCGLTVTEILAEENKSSQQETGAYRIRSPIKPVTLSEIAQCSED
jgi:NADPH-dependent 2,4-dienoyl-CoA reductase/sulfur reductase-like enzyme